ncbi:alpha-amylase family glycosyl hydrolase [Pedobacter endophyticus]|uniref:DUF3459 domain-containing protein n=1 Tax=Pedobacter endophyticus TaxID=2789740 RepID=A0A7S9PZQ6_9SPHI|nr:alpha-amylase family glycosyl hydrolase [Pedobacter endophyticus]QPH40175.1 DUF3459 domain-containing protein [Pedobacter endophyticus]
MDTHNDAQWWKGTIIYQIYPRSFKDSNGDGVGDLNGVIEKLDYLQHLGIETIWISPIYPSPMADFGYDISDYCGVDALFGTLEDFDRLMNEVHNRGMKLLLDFVPNHSSNLHPWFLESRSSKDNPKRSWYIWKDAAPDGGPPNNWLAMFGGSAWQWDETTSQYYYHGFLSEQPDLNWRNEAVQEAMLNVMRFWLDKGVDGFRVDVIWHMVKDELLRDNPVNPDYTPEMATYNQLLPVFSTDQPEVHRIINKMRTLLDHYKDKVMIGEIYLPIQRLMAYYGQDDSGAHMPFNFTLLETPWDAKAIGLAIDQYEGALPAGGWPNWVLGNHDQHRVLSRVGAAQARVAAVLLLTLRGTPTMYYGDEIGMSDVKIPPNEIRDPQGLNMPEKGLSRDPARTPMQWDGTTFGGFSTCQPWLRLAEDHKDNNVASQMAYPQSMLNLYRKLIALRQSSPSLKYGIYRPVLANSQLLAYIRQAENAPGYLIILNLSDSPAPFLPPVNLSGEIIFSTNDAGVGEFLTQGFEMGANDATIVEIKERP